MVIGLLGFGTVGGGVYEMLRDRMCMDVKYVLCLENPEGLAGKLVRSVDQILSDDTVDTVVEVMGGLHPAREFVLQAMAAGKNVVTANKLLLAECYEELTEAAAQNHVALRCTAAVGGGIGWLTALERCKRTERVHELTGIMNGTTNYILDTMQTRGVSFADALHQAQELGYAERDPAADIDGEDILNKLVVSANVAFDALLQKADVPVFGIRSVQLADMQTFRERGWCCRLIASAEHYGEGVCAVTHGHGRNLRVFNCRLSRYILGLCHTEGPLGLSIGTPEQVEGLGLAVPIILRPITTITQNSERP